MLKMKLKYLVRYMLLAFVLVAGAANEAQAQDPEFTQYYANPLFLNPAFAEVLTVVLVWLCHTETNGRL